MQIIKKYANRKLYHTNRKQYITLEGIARLVQNGEPVQVLDNESGEDITPTILAQIVLNNRGRNGSPLPANLLANLIQIGGDTLSGVRRALFASLGGFDLIAAEVTYRLRRLVEDDEISLQEAGHIEKLLLQREFSDPDTASGLAEVDVPSRNDVANLHSQVDALSALIDELMRERDRKPEQSSPNGA
jgi:polyhydroxyalkanoate synthesis repressor PhaR